MDPRSASRDESNRAFELFREQDITEIESQSDSDCKRQQLLHDLYIHPSWPTFARTSLHITVTSPTPLSSFSGPMKRSKLNLHLNERKIFAFRLSKKCFQRLIVISFSAPAIVSSLIWAFSFPIVFTLKHNLWVKETGKGRTRLHRRWLISRERRAV